MDLIKIKMGEGTKYRFELKSGPPEDKDMDLIKIKAIGRKKYGFH